MKLTSDNETLAENKVLILYILNTVNKPVNNDELLQLVLSITDMNYFYFQQFLLDLIENKYIENYHPEDSSESLYRITNSGIEALNLTQELVPGIIKLKVDQTIKGELETIEEEVSITSEFIPYSEKEFTVKCKVIENNKTIFEVSTFASSREQAKYISDNWKENAINIYPNNIFPFCILSIIVKNIINVGT